MKVGVLLVTHVSIGRSLVQTVQDMLDDMPLNIETLEVRRVRDTGALTSQGRKLVERLDQGAGVLILTDAYGSTPSNIANLIAEENCRVVSGVNLPMLVSVCNYPDRNLQALADMALQGGRDGIVVCQGDN